MPTAPTLEEQIKTQQQQGGTTPAGKTPPRSYRVLVLDPPEEGAYALWVDHGWHPGPSQESAIKHARAQIPEVRKALTDGQSVVAVPESYFEPMTVGIETVEREVFKKVKV